MDETWWTLLRLGTMAPIWLLWVAGIVLAAITARRNPTASLLAAVGLLGMLLASVGWEVLWQAVIRSEGRRSSDGDLLWFASLVATTANVVFTSLVLGAVFAGRLRR